MTTVAVKVALAASAVEAPRPHWRPSMRVPAPQALRHVTTAIVANISVGPVWKTASRNQLHWTVWTQIQAEHWTPDELDDDLTGIEKFNSTFKHVWLRQEVAENSAVG